MHQMSHDEYLSFMAEGTRTAKLATVRADGRPHVVPIWFVMDGDDLVFTTARESVKGRSIRRDGRVALSVDDQAPPYSFVMVEGKAGIVEGDEDMLLWATRLGGRYMGEDRAEEFGRRNAVPEEMLVRLRPEKVVAVKNMTD